MNKLKLMGIQQWRLRADTRIAEPPATQEDDTPPAMAPVTDLIESRQQIEPDTNISSQPASLIEPEISWDSLQQVIFDQGGCQYCAAAKPMLGTGDQQADYVFIIATPSDNDMQRQQLLSGRDGQLFDGMLRAMKLTREQVYLTSACKCVVNDDSSSSLPCTQLVHQQLRLIQPEVIVTFGQRAAQWLIKSNENLAVLRTQVQKCHNTDIPVVVTHDLAQLLAQPQLKTDTWQDLRTAMHSQATTNTI